MKTSDFDYPLPERLIAQAPCAVRSHSRLLHYSRFDKSIHHHQFSDFIALLKPGDLLVFNNTQVIPARIYGNKATGGKVEILIERLIDDFQCLAHIRASKTPKTGSEISLHGNGPDYSTGSQKKIITVENTYDVTVTGREGNLFRLVSELFEIATIMQDIGHMPLPPYIQREDNNEDVKRYQTVYASTPGAVAAPTAGLHFDEAIIERIRLMNVELAYVTLHVGAGTFQPVRSEHIEDHPMHFEYLTVPDETVDKCRLTRQNGGRIIAIGTTTVRALETAAQHASKQRLLEAYSGETNIFIYPGYEFKCIDALLTNFHLPQSTLLMLISAFAGKDEMLRCYAEAVAQEYRFFSYGDAMFIS